jgi:uncharacterized protein YcbX
VGQTRRVIGTLQEIGRFPVKSMLGESPRRAEVTSSGVVGDRTHALVDAETGKVASAKRPRLWGGLLRFRARLGDEAVEITLPDGTAVRDDDPDVDAQLSAAVGREVHLTGTADPGGSYDYVWEEDGLAPDEVVAGSRTGTEDGRPLSSMPLAFLAPGTFQDVAPITIMTTAALRTMRHHHPEGRWEQARFRSNLLLDVDAEGIVENGWPGRRLRIGGAEFEVTFAAPRCVMTTLPQGDLPKDRAILQTVARENRQEFAGLGIWACLGVYATVAVPGVVAVGDEVTLV